MADEHFITTAEAAALLHVSEETVRRYTRTGKLSAVKVGGHKQSPIRIPISSVIAHLHPAADRSAA
jgi:excisionase family DNA binding protein